MGTEETAVLFGVHIFEQEWTYLYKKVTVIDNVTKTEKLANLYTLRLWGQKKEFAVLESGMGIYQFFTLEFEK